MKERIIKWIWQHQDYPNFKQVEGTAGRNVRYKVKI